MKSKTKLSMLAVAIGALVSAATAAQTFTFRHGVNGYSGTQDTTIREAIPTTVLGADDFVSVDASDDGAPNHVLIRFDSLFGSGPGQINPAFTIASALLHMNVVSAGSGFAMYDMLTDWSHATATWDSFGGNGIQPGVEASALP